MSLTIVSKDNKLHNQPKKKHYIILDQKERMYLSKEAMFVSEKRFALGIDNPKVATMALNRINELRKQQKITILCTLIHV